MRTLLLLWVALAGAGAQLPCPHGGPCPVTPALPARSAMGCQDSSSCPPTSCQLPESVPCAGGHHCCPRGSQCSADGESCVTDLAPRAVPCPDGQSECPDDATCCVTSSGTWGCCPMPQASCCADKVHCCPHATVCDLTHGRCVSPTGDTDVPLSTPFPAWKRQPPAPALRQVLCPDGRSACPDGSTCCQLSPTEYGCCPLQNAVCCSDKQHCCPQGTSCDLAHSTCTSLRASAPPAALPTARDVKCDERTSCPDGNTCCRLISGAWGCCPLEQAVCCPDHVHCCPQGYTCDPKGGSCLQEGGTRLPWVLKTPALPRGGQVTSGNVICDETSSCPDGTTCCRLSLGTWGCCPLEKAVCCPDHVHCCPQGYTCDPERGNCLQEGGTRLPWVLKTPALPRGGQVTSRNVICDETSSCPDGTTCCRLSLGTWGCCPLEKAVCCPDHVHCCPQGYTCDPERGNCLQEGGTRLPWVLKTPALPRGGQVTSGNVICDETSSCPDGTTCCRLSLGTWGCCPFEKAVCCPDHVHCCPQGYTCDPERGSCLQEGGTRLPWVLKTPALPRGGQVTSGNVICDETSSCPDGTTCCRLSLGTWGCCPLEKAVCCPDHVHCCPQGYTCDPEGGNCLQEGGTRLPWVLKTPALPRGGQVTLRDVKCDEKTSCPDGSTCCQLGLGTWGCCPLEQAVCCGDHQHCCPRGYTCNVATESCEKLLVPTPLLPTPSAPRRAPSAPRRAPPVPLRATGTHPGGLVPCGTAGSCRGGQRCCPARGGSWGCCPFAQGSCCSDGRRCCPAGSRCTAGGWGCSPQRWDLL